MSRRVLVPDPPTKPADPILESLVAGSVIYHVWRAAPDRDARTFNPRYGEGRFHPIRDASAIPIPTWYGAESADGAIFESVFHNCREGDPDPQIFPHDYEGRMLGSVTSGRSMHMASFNPPGLHRLRAPAELITAGPAHYLRTARWAEHVHGAATRPDGLVWTSRKHSPDQAWVLFGDRVSLGDLYAGSETAIPLDVGSGFERVLELGERSRIRIIIRV